MCNRRVPARVRAKSTGRDGNKRTSPTAQDFADLVALDSRLRPVRCAERTCRCHRGATRGTGELRLHCPAHHNVAPAMTMTIRDGHLLAKCHSVGCPTSALYRSLVALGIWWPIPAHIPPQPGPYLAEGKPQASAPDGETRKNSDAIEENEVNEPSPGFLRQLRFLRREENWPDPLADAAYHGILGKIVRTIAPETEADPALILAALLAAAGNALNRNPYFQIGRTRHYPTLFVVGIGPTSVGRKDTALDWARGVVEEATPEWRGRCVSGLSTGEGLINAVRDPSEEIHPKTGEPLAAGVTDKRLFVGESEISKVLRVMDREHNTLSAVVRDAFDCKPVLRVLTRNLPLKATFAHIAIAMNGTESDLRRYLTEVEMANGFGNRFLWILAKRARELPFGGMDVEQTLAPLITQLGTALAKARTIARVEFADDARELWPEMYRTWTAPRPGLLGAITDRAVVMIRRIALIYTVLDGCYATGAAQLHAASAAWNYSFAAAQYLFGHRTGDMIADTLRRLLMHAGAAGVTRWEMSNAFSRNVSQARIEAALALLADMGL